MDREWTALNAVAHVPHHAILEPVSNESRVSVRIGPQGRIVIPAQLRRRLGLEPGEILTAHADEDRLVLEPVSAALRRIRERHRSVATGASMVDELIADRREEARREEEELRRSGL